MRLLTIALAAMIALGSGPALADKDDDDDDKMDFGANRVNRLAALVLGDGAENDFAVNMTEIEMEAGKRYVLPVIAKGYKEYRLEAPDFFQSILVSQVVINDLEVHTTRIDAMEFDDNGEMELYFVPVRKGKYEWEVEGFGDKGMKGTFEIE